MTDTTIRDVMLFATGFGFTISVTFALIGYFINLAIGFLKKIA